MYPYVSDYYYLDLQVSLSDWHPNAKTHQIFAKIISNYLIDHNLVN